MILHYLQHVPFEGLGSIEKWAVEKGHSITSTRFFSDYCLPPIDHFDGLVVMGGPMNIYEHERYPWLNDEKRFLKQAIASGKVVLGICLGAQLLADVLGAKIYSNRLKEIGWFPVCKSIETKECKVFRRFPSLLDVFHWHSDTFDLPAGAVRLASSAACENQAFSFYDRVIGLQFHMETTKQGVERLITNCREELIDGPYIQEAEKMLLDDARFELINASMEELLNELF